MSGYNQYIVLAILKISVSILTILGNSQDYFQLLRYFTSQEYNILMPVIDEEKLGLRLIRSFDQRKNKHYKEQYMSQNACFDKFFGKTDVYCILEK